jgi:hypothetical protein
MAVGTSGGDFIVERRGLAVKSVPVTGRLFLVAIATLLRNLQGKIAGRGGGFRVRHRAVAGCAQGRAGIALLSGEAVTALVVVVAHVRVAFGAGFRQILVAQR